MTSAAARMRAHRQRQAIGRMVLQHVEIDLVSVADMLVGAGVLDPLKSDSRHEIERGVEKLLVALIHAELLGAEGG
jgi:hypothetical protein